MERALLNEGRKGCRGLPDYPECIIGVSCEPLTARPRGHGGHGTAMCTKNFPCK